MNTMLRLALFFLLFLPASQIWGVSIVQHQYDAESVIFSVDAYVYDTPLNLHTCDNQCIEPEAQDIIKGHFLALVGDFLATKSANKEITKSTRWASSRACLRPAVYRRCPPYTYLVGILQCISLHLDHQVLDLTTRVWKEKFSDKSLQSDLAPVRQ